MNRKRIAAMLQVVGSGLFLGTLAAVSLEAAGLVAGAGALALGYVLEREG